MGQSISTTQFYLYGKKHFTKTGYERHIKQYVHPVQSSTNILRNQDGADGVDMGNKVVVVTGANSGLGKEISTYAAAKGATVYMICRSKDRAEKARDDIVQATSASSNQVKILLADVGELEQVRKVVAELQSKEGKVDVLVCNAGVLLNERTETKEGLEATFASHLLGGSYLLSQLLMPQLKKGGSSSTGAGRVIFVSSGGMYNVKWPADWATATSSSTIQTNGQVIAPPEYNGQFAYAYAKRGQVLLAEQLATLEPEIKWVSAHPGWVETPAVDEAYGDNKKYLAPMRNTWEGAEGICWLMHHDPSTDIESGAFYLDRTPQRKHLAGPFMTEGSYTKNSKQEVEEMMRQLKMASEPKN